MDSVQSSSIITQSNMTWYCIRFFSDWDRLSIRVLMTSVFYEDFGEKLLHYNGTALYFSGLHNPLELMQ